MELARPNPADHMLMFKKRLWIMEYSSRMQRMLRGEKLPPLRIDAEPHRRCSFSCVHCSRRTIDGDINAHSKRIEVPEQRWYEIAHESGEMGVKAWNIAGICEPMLKPEMMMELMGIIKEHSMFGELTTNGWHWEDRHILKTVEMGWDCLSVSIDGPDAASHDGIRRTPGSFRRACSTLRRFAAVRRKLKTHLPNLTVNLVLNRYNHENLPEMVRLTSKLGADVLFVEPMVAYSEEQRRDLAITEAQRVSLRRSVSRAVQLAEKRNIYAFISCLDGEDENKEFNAELAESGGEIREVILKGTREQADRYAGTGKEHQHDMGVQRILNIPCYYPWLNLMITAEGNAVHCGECDEPKDNIQEKDLKDIWWGDRLEHYRQRHAEGMLSPFCEKCRPNVIGDMKIVRKSIKEYYDMSTLQDKLIRMMEHSLDIKRELYYATYGGVLRPVRHLLSPPEKQKAARLKVMDL